MGVGRDRTERGRRVEDEERRKREEKGTERDKKKDGEVIIYVPCFIWDIHPYSLSSPLSNKSREREREKRGGEVNEE